MLLIMSVILSFTINSCDDNNSNLNYGSIQGKVTDGESSELLENVQISTVPSSSVVTTNNKGNYRIENLLPYSYDITFSKPGYISKTVSIQILSGKTTNTDVFLIKSNGSPIDSNNIGKDQALNSFMLTRYKFDGNTNSTNNSLLNFYGTDVGYTSNKFGINNKAIQFYGRNNSYLYSEMYSLFNLNEFSYIFWLNPDETYGTDYYDYIDVISRWGNWGQDNQSFAFSLSKQGHIKGMFYNMIQNQTDHPDNYSFFQSPGNLISKVWTNVAITFKNNSLKIYLNGELNFEMNVIQPQPSMLYGLCVGKRFDNNQLSFYKGLMDDLRIYKKELTKDEIKIIMDNIDS